LFHCEGTIDCRWVDATPSKHPVAFRCAE
jgi:hypothetical protein